MQRRWNEIERPGRPLFNQGRITPSRPEGPQESAQGKMAEPSPPWVHAITLVFQIVAHQRCAGERVPHGRQPCTAQPRSPHLLRSFRARPWERRGVVIQTLGLLVPRSALG